MHYVSVKAHKRGPAKKLHHIEIRYHYSSGHPPSSREFKPSEHRAALASLQEHMGVEGSAGEEAAEAPKMEAEEQQAGVE